MKKGEDLLKLRKLTVTDAPLMLEWMHDPDVVENMGTNFASKTIDDCRAFIASTSNDANNLHYAIADENDTYMGTVSLKHINKARNSAEFAITIRKAAMGKGISQFAMNEIIRIGLDELGLSQIYWYVSSRNARAVRFYDKNGYPRVAPEALLVEDVVAMCSLPDLLYYAVNK